LSVGDAFGERLFLNQEAIDARRLPVPRWETTDDTEMAIAIFCLWTFARHLGDYAETLWTTVSVPGDRDTTCAIVGGLAAALAGTEGIPSGCLAAREPLRHDLDLA
jgi:ADP-ribosylglycohydrolase